MVRNTIHSLITTNASYPILLLYKLSLVLVYSIHASTKLGLDVSWVTLLSRNGIELAIKCYGGIFPYSVANNF